MNFDYKKLIDGIKQYINDALNPLHDRIKSLEDDDSYVTKADFDKAVSDAVEKRLESFRVPADGRDGIDIEILPHIDLERSYPRNTYAKHNGGLWKSFQATDAMKGWECIVNGVNSIDVEQTEEKTFSVKMSMSDDHVIDKSFSLPLSIYKEIFKEDQEYTKGDMVTYGGSVWYCKSEKAEGKPGLSNDWKLAVKKGRDGK